MFTIVPTNPETYRQQTRRITLFIAGGFILLTLLLSTAMVKLFGTSGGDNFRWNLIGVLVGLALTIALVRLHLGSQPWVAPAVYGWQLKRSQMTREIDQHREAMTAAGLDVEQNRLDPAWLEAVKRFGR